jgi:hypothetical protein
MSAETLTEPLLRITMRLIEFYSRGKLRRVTLYFLSFFTQSFERELVAPRSW